MNFWQIENPDENFIGSLCLHAFRLGGSLALPVLKLALLVPDREAGSEKVIVGGIAESDAHANIKLDVVVQKKCEATVEVVLRLVRIGTIGNKRKPLGVAADAIG